MMNKKYDHMIFNLLLQLLNQTTHISDKRSFKNQTYTQIVLFNLLYNTSCIKKKAQV